MKKYVIRDFLLESTQVNHGLIVGNLNHFLKSLHKQKTRLHSADGSVSDYRYISDCRSRDHDFDPSPMVLLSTHTICLKKIKYTLLSGGLLSVWKH